MPQTTAHRSVRTARDGFARTLRTARGRWRGVLAGTAGVAAVALVVAVSTSGGDAGLRVAPANDPGVVPAGAPEASVPAVATTAPAEPVPAPTPERVPVPTAALTSATPAPEPERSAPAPEPSRPADDPAPPPTKRRATPAPPPPWRAPALQATVTYVAGGAPDPCAPNRHGSGSEHAAEWCTQYLGVTEARTGSRVEVPLRVCRSGAEGVAAADLSTRLHFSVSDQMETWVSWFDYVGSDRRQVVQPGDCVQWTIGNYEARWQEAQDGHRAGDPLPPGVWYLNLGVNVVDLEYTDKEGKQQVEQGADWFSFYEVRLTK